MKQRPKEKESTSISRRHATGSVHLRANRKKLKGGKYYQKQKKRRKEKKQ